MKRASNLVAGALVFTTLACQELHVTNPNNPDREVVVQSAVDVEALVATSFRRYFNLTHGTTPSVALANSADQFSGGFFDFGMQMSQREPREAINNDPTAPTSPNRVPISTLYSIIGGLNIALQAIQDRDLKIMEGQTDVTRRAQAFAKFVQGLSHAYAALVYDQSWLMTEDLDLEALAGEGQTAQQALIGPYPEVRDLALAQLNAALDLADQNEFVLPGGGAGEWFPGLTLTNKEFARLIHTYIARTMVYWARSPAERAQVDWDVVIQHIDQGVTADFAPVGTPEVFESVYKHRSARQRTTIPGDFMRVDYMVVGPADQSNRFIDWYNTPWTNRQPFSMQGVVDKRIIKTPTAGCTSSLSNATTNEGSYIGCHVATIWAADRGTGTRTYYYFHRLGRLTSWQTGPLLIVPVSEMNLLKAEGLIRLGRADEAVPLINLTREANGGLPPVTLAGVPGTAPACTPRKLNGDCGSLWDALRYEKRIEGLGVDGAVAHWDARGWQALVENTPIHYPIPGNELELMGMPMYTAGGGQPGSAPAPDPEKCPVALPRCP